jgi:anti-sigma factor RsiW
MSVGKTETEAGTEIDDEIIVALSDYLDGALTGDRKTEVEAKIETDPTWKSAHAELLETRHALSGLQKARAPATFGQDVTATIHKRSAGRFFGRKTFGDRVPFGALVVVAVLGLIVIAYVMWASSTGSLKVDRDRRPPTGGSGAIVTP